MWESVGTGLVRLCLLIDSFIYGVVSKLFSLFVELANNSSKIFSDSVISSFTNRIYILVGVIALFIITYTLLISVVNPDDVFKGKNSGPKIITNLVTSIILVILLPSIFSFGYKVQDAILEDNIIGRLFLGTENSDPKVEEKVIYNSEEKVAYEVTLESETDLVKQHGNNLAWSVLSAFFYPEDLDGDGYPDDVHTDWSNSWGKYRSVSKTTNLVTCVAGGAVFLINLASVPFSGGSTSAALPYTGGVAAAACGLASVNNAVALVGYNLTDEHLYWGEMRQRVLADGEFGLMSAYAEEIEKDEVTYMPVVSTIVGIILLYLIFSFCLDLGLRAVKLAFYQMIAPIPIFARILPNNKIFNNWIKVVCTTFMEVFVRMIILYTMVFLASNISNLEIFGSNFAKMIIIMGIVTFGKQAPKLLAEVTGIDSGNMKLGIGEKLGTATFGLSAGIAGAATGFLGAGIASRAAGGGFFRGGLSGMANGWKARGNQFGNQKQKMYKSLGGKGTAGLLGRQSLLSRANDKMTKGQMKKIQDQVSDKAGARQSVFESGTLFNSEKQNIIANDKGYNELQASLANVENEINSYNVDGINETIANSDRQMGYYKETMEYKDFAARKENSEAQIFKDHFYDKELSMEMNREKFNEMRSSGQLQRIIDSRFANTDGENAKKFAEHFNAKLQAERDLEAEKTRLQSLQAQRDELETTTKKYLSEKDKDFVDAARKRIKSDEYKTTSNYKEFKHEIESYKQDLEHSKEKFAELDKEKKSSERLLKDLEKLMKDNEKK